MPELLADFGVIQHRDDVWPVVATELGANTIDLKNWVPPQALLDLVPAGTARLHGALPVNFDGQGLHIALVDPLNPQTIEDLRFTSAVKSLSSLHLTTSLKLKLMNATAERAERWMIFSASSI